MTKQTIKAAVRGSYDVQKVRIQLGNRIVANWRAKQGIMPSAKTETGDKDTQKMLKQIKTDYARVTDGLVRLPTRKKFMGTWLISQYGELVLIAQYMDLVEAENSMFKRLNRLLDAVPIYNEYLKDVKGIGPAMAGVIVSEIDIYRAKYPSSLWKYAGLDVAEDGRGRSRRKEHLIDAVYNDKNGDEKTRKSITFNPFLKTKLTGVLGPSFMKQGERSLYTEIYYHYKHRLESHSIYKDVTKGHRHNMAIRYMIKQFLSDLYVAWRTLEGLPVSVPYSEAKLGMRHAA